MQCSTAVQYSIVQYSIVRVVYTNYTTLYGIVSRREGGGSGSGIGSSSSSSISSIIMMVAVLVSTLPGIL